MNSPGLRSAGRNTLVILLLLVVGAPFIWMLLSSFRPTSDLIQADQMFMVRQLSLHNYLQLREGNYLVFLRNSLFVALFSTLVAVPLALLAAYSVYRTRYRGRIAAYRLMLAVYVFPGVLLLIPLYKIFSMLSLINSRFSLVIINVTFAAPFSVWLMRGFFTSMPEGVEEAAALDGASIPRMLRSIILPLTAPGVAVAATFTFILSWTEYLFASVFIVDDALKTLPVGLGGLVSGYFIDWGVLSAAAVATAVPAVLLFGLTGRFFVQSITSGAGR
ncbi:MAG TPA: carbohydrate ABC transporter permease [Anaerolineales bacterium]